MFAKIEDYFLTCDSKESSNNIPYHSRRSYKNEKLANTGVADLVDLSIDFWAAAIFSLSVNLKVILYVQRKLLLLLVFNLVYFFCYYLF